MENYGIISMKKIKKENDKKVKFGRKRWQR